MLLLQQVLPQLTTLPAPLLLYLQVQEADDAAESEAMMREVMEDYMSKAEAFKQDLGDKRLTVEHMLLAMAEVRQCSALPSVQAMAGVRQQQAAMQCASKCACSVVVWLRFERHSTCCWLWLR
jgi:hypothetical protein